ncbi:hypothetical protein A3H77_01815 [Candidatus Kaiserbacteria bacterium RIFCSPLOWO2_02_FULL_56_11]|uniref:OmpR/PhoB-type domain-containing protein n=2 Tax=Candidatus Kaiseribacteriota TaxID=1752734 RepID=A0A1F6E595_9BACT|nr:MAG: hypothetical protein A3C95_01480 [Candidatus Kaiserbacteria bacterium RIFCSPHIGHO2_02_FULL_56_30]OGG72010.1 MAG: hypothetical protein A3E65_01370 [Candidatus Kaiserbacteria bacterium RIFCSPHIGHO2_12_FULL_56_13]OGG82119.1 MAG: hypothetical protein A3H77_01815 [Candidatus Kaiserbacteria bacterium RIFCSPLOWO2_02_FULL_56_11]
MKILAVGLDDTTITFLRNSGVLVEPQEIENAGELLAWLQDSLYEACVFDLDKGGFGVYTARDPRVRKITTTFIGISRGSEDRVWSDYRAIFLENGGDDLLRGPVNPRELVASLRAVTRRLKGAVVDIVELRNGDAALKVNLTTTSIRINGNRVDLTGKETSLMLLLAASPGRVLSKEMLMLQLYTEGVDDEPEMKIIDVFICKLRRKLADAHPDATKFIETVWGRGYRLPSQSELTKSTEKMA